MVLENQNLEGTEGVYTRYQDGTRHKQHPLVPSEKVIVIPIQLYADGPGTTNPLSGVACEHNCTNFYFVDLSLPPKYHASLSNINFVSCCKSIDIKEISGQEAMMRVIVDDLIDLETKGFEIDIPGRGLCKVFVTLAQFTADNLAINQTFGLIESFAHDFCCALCYCTKNEMQSGFHEKCFRARTAALHSLDIAELNANPNLNHVRGVKYDCLLNLLLYFHVMENWVNYIMHTFLEAILPYVLV